MFTKEKDQLIGMINFGRFERGVFQCCGLGYRLHHQFEGQGYMSEGPKTATSYIFEQLNFHRIEANYIPSNLRSGKLLKKLGFIEEGLAKNYLMIEGVWQDHILTGLTHS